MIDELLPAAKSMYQTIEKQENISIYHQRALIWVLENAGDENEFSRRAGDEMYQPYIASDNPSDFSNIKNSTYRKFINQAAQVNIAKMIEHFQIKWEATGVLQNGKFDYSQLVHTENGVSYNNQQFDYIIFCEGNRAVQNPFFGHLNFNISKGEVLIVKIPDLKSEMIVKNGVTIAPLGEELYWVGSTFTWKEENDLPSSKGREILIEKLKNAVTTSFEIVDHLAAFRPTVFDRRPLIGVHPEFNNYLIFNGFGSKGASLAPYWTLQFVDFLSNTHEISKEVSILRKNAFPNPTAKP